MRSENHIINLNNQRLGGRLDQTTAAPGTGGGTCYGDSGGPFFVTGTHIVVATTITGTNRNCGGADLNLRIDTEEVQDFLAAYV
jgi:secreted trypsin-like serine protease